RASPLRWRELLAVSRLVPVADQGCAEGRSGGGGAGGLFRHAESSLNVGRSPLRVMLPLSAPASLGFWKTRRETPHGIRHARNPAGSVLCLPSPQRDGRAPRPH